jgi:hypothetical protein
MRGNLAITMGDECTLDSLDDDASVAVLLLISGQEGGAGCVLEDFSDALTSPG